MTSCPLAARLREEEGYPAVCGVRRRGFSRDDDLAPDGLHRAAVYLTRFEPGSGDPET
ncbi:MAG: hypothetical protein GX965_03395 [Methanoculleus bourgensis]|nr:hypothetical protein [Methanoculleus bourgensis]